MSKKITALSIAILVFALSVTVAMKNESSVKTDVSSFKGNSYAASDSASTTSLKDYVSDQVGNITNIGGIIGDISDIGGDLGNLVGGGSGLGGLGGSGGAGIGDAIGGIGDVLGGILNNNQSGGSGGTGSGTYAVNTETLGYIDVVPAVSNFTLPASTVTQAASSEETSRVNETVDFAATANPYQKPTGELKGGDSGEGVKWMQWIFIYTRYGLKDDGITGVFDEDTMAVVKKLQKSTGITVDGVVDEEVIAQIELLYLQEIYGTTLAGTTVQESSQQAQNDEPGEKDDSSELLPLIIAVIVLWIVAIVFAVVIFIKKKKKKSTAKKVTESKPEPEQKAEDSSQNS